MQTDAEITERKKLILRAVVDAYIETSRPVSSKNTAKLSGLNLSPATIRNEMSELTKMGYLEQPHTSAGRIPSPLAYRVYINELMREQKLSVQETKEINDALRQRLAQLDALIADLTQMVTELTSHPAFALLKSRAYLTGAANALDRPGYDEIEKARQLLAYIDNEPAALPAPEITTTEEVTENGQ
ncbi:MAG: hypothetical protein LBN43_04625 [Oscillospiraceae bacterium]|jgi:heat-inducible transcriptional repressor|nr:hypothetical protein [Oscillospiraceae bacterium]